MGNTASHAQRQQSVKLAIDCKTGELVPADALLAMPEPEFTALRRAAMAARRQRRRGGDTVRYQCALCKRHAGHGEVSSVGLKNETVDPSRAHISAITGLWMPASLGGMSGNGAEVQPQRA